LAAHAHAIGFLPSGGSGTQNIIGVGEAQADVSLKNARINVALNVLRVANYPGGGTHRVLFDFYARNQVPGTSEDLHFNSAYRAREGERRRSAVIRFSSASASARPGLLFTSTPSTSRTTRTKLFSISSKETPSRPAANSRPPRSQRSRRFPAWRLR
jgi:hypothetical protein